MKAGAAAAAARETPAELQVELWAHKLTAPQRYSGAIRRRAIVERLVERDDDRVVFLQGPAGHGKSTALQQLKSEFEARGVLTAWLSFDKADNDIRRFSIHLEAAIASLLRDRSEAVVEAPYVPGKQRRCDRLIARLAMLGQPVALFFDDFQTLADPQILAFFQDFFERLPERIRVFIGTRSIPEVGLSRLVINRQATILRADELRFSGPEIAEFFAADPQLALTPDEIHTIERRSDGWPAALQLFRLVLVSPSVRQALGDLESYRPRELAEYLVDNVLSLQAPHIQEFLLKTSVLNTMTASLCDAVTGRSDSQELLLHLERAGLFVRSLDSELRWFKYHPLFASFLCEQLRAGPADASLEVHRRAARWCLKHLLHEEAVKHALACQDFRLAADTMSIWFARLIADAQLATVEHWCGQLPFDEIARRPALTVELAYALVFLRRYTRLQPCLNLLRSSHEAGSASAGIVLAMAAIGADDLAGAFAIIGGIEVHAPQGEAFQAFEFAAAANLRGYRALTLGDFDGLRESLSLARAHNARGEASFSGGYTTGIRGVGLMAQGQLQEALEVFGLGMTEQRMPIDKSYSSAAIVSCYIWSLYEANQLDRVEILFAQYHDLMSGSVLLDFLTVAYLAMARTHDARGRSAKALEMLDEAELLGHANGWPRLLRIVNWERIRRALLAGALDRAVAIAAHLPGTQSPLLPEAWVPFSEDLEGESLGRIRLAIHSRQHELAATLLGSEFARQGGRVHRQIKLNLLEAQLHDSKGLRNAAQRSLRRALQLARPGGFLRTFLDEGDGLLRLLREAYQSALDGSSANDGDASERSFIETLLQASGIDLSRSPLRHPATVSEPLTEREKQILSFLANGISNREMASRVFLSENTVKFHLKNIYSKLEVSGRLKAIAAARQRGLLN